jgi:hypothetical protein
MPEYANTLTVADWSVCSTGSKGFASATATSLAITSSPTKSHSSLRSSGALLNNRSYWVGLPLALLSAEIVSSAYVREQSAVAALCAVSLKVYFSALRLAPLFRAPHRTSGFPRNGKVTVRSARSDLVRQPRRAELRSPGREKERK